MIAAGKIEAPAWMADAPTQRLFAALKAAGIAARFVGGCVRNALLGRPSTISISRSTSRPRR